MTICRITRLSSATRIFTGTPSSVMRGSVMSTGQRRQCALHGDGDRLAPPADVDADDVGGGPGGGGPPHPGAAPGGGGGGGGPGGGPRDGGGPPPRGGDRRGARAP